MAEWHVPVEWLERFLCLETSEEESRQVARHLAMGCAECADLVYRITTEIGLAGAPQDGRAIWEVVYEEVFARAFAFANEGEQRLALERLRGWGQWAYLEPLPPSTRIAVVASDPRYHTVALHERLLEAALWASRNEPAEAVDIVRLAILVVDLVEPAALDAKRRADLRAAGSAALGNALRIADDFKQARLAFNEAWRFLEEGTGDPVEEARLISLEASYMKDLGDFELAEAALAEALLLARKMEDPHEQGRILFQMGDVIGYVQPERGIAHIRKALMLLDGPRDRRLELSALHDLALYLNDGGQPEEALAVLERTRPLYSQFPDDMTQLRLHWLEGKIAHRLGEIEEAEVILAQLWEEFRARGLYQEVVLITIELAQLLTEKGEPERAARLAAESFTIMKRWGLRADALSAWIVFQDALAQGAGVGDLFERVGEYYRRHWVRPGRFEGAGSMDLL
jgi:tetratricopeptide (TPR) repeat protein